MSLYVISLTVRLETLSAISLQPQLQNSLVVNPTMSILRLTHYQQVRVLSFFSLEQIGYAVSRLYPLV